MNPLEEQTSPSRRSRAARRVLIGVTLLLAVGVLLLAAAVGFAVVQNRRVHRITLDRPVGTEAPPVSQVPKGSPLNVLVVGSDSRAFAKDAKDKRQFGTGNAVDGQRSDTMLVIHLDPQNGTGIVLSIARDLYVDLDGGGRGRLNEGFASKADATKSDPGRLIRTIRSSFGIQVNHYVAMDFNGFRDIVEAIGGVKVYFPSPARDEYSLLNIPQPGCIQLNGEQALSYVRSRHYQTKGPRGWVFDGTGDIGRIGRQQDFIRRVVRKAVSDGLTDPVETYRLIDAGIANITVDQSFGLPDIRQLAAQLKGLDDGRITFVALTGDPVTIGGAEVLRVNPAQANPVLALFDAFIPGTAPVPALTPTTIPATGPDPASLC